MNYLLLEEALQLLRIILDDDGPPLTDLERDMLRASADYITEYIRKDYEEDQRPF